MFYLLFTALSTLWLLIALPTMFIYSLIYWWRDRDARLLLKVLAAAAGFLAGVIVVWSIVVVRYEWHLPLGETIYAAGRADIYGHEVEHFAESTLLLMLFAGNLCAIASGVAGWVIGRRRPRPAV